MKRYVKTVFSSFILLALVVTAACSSNQNGPVTSGDSNVANNNNKNEEVKVGPLGKYETPITVTMVRNQENNTTFPEGDSMEDNIYTRGYLDELGIKIENEWITEDSQYYERLNLAITAGDLPDIFRVTGTMLAELSEAGMIADLTDVYNETVTPLLDEFMNSDGGVGLRMSTIDGKLMALPYITAGADGSTMVWIRTDWMENLGLEPPKTIDDVIEIARAFTYDDPDQNGVNDTVGIGLTRNIFGGGGGLKAFFNGYHVYPNIWTEDGNGRLVNGVVQPEMKEALAKLQEMYSMGIMDQEFPTKTGIGEDVISGRIGMFFGTMSQPLNPLQQSKDRDPNADWQFYPIVSIDGSPAKPQIDYTPPQYYVVNKDAEHPEALVNLMNFFVEKSFGETADFRYQYDDNHSSHKYAFVRNFGATKNVISQKTITEVYETGDESVLNVEQQGYYDQIRQYEAGDESMWKYWKIFGPHDAGSLSLVNRYLDEDMVVVDQFQALPTQKMVEVQSVLSDLTNETFTKIILGDPIDGFDKFVDDWYKLGGEKIEQEVNDWYETN